MYSLHATSLHSLVIFQMRFYIFLQPASDECLMMPSTFTLDSTSLLADERSVFLQNCDSEFKALFSTLLKKYCIGRNFSLEENFTDSTLLKIFTRINSE